MQHFNNLFYFSNPHKILKIALNYFQNSVKIIETNDINLNQMYLVKGPWYYEKKYNIIFKEGNFLHLDNGYFKKNLYKRLTINALQQNKIIDVPDDRLQKVFNNNILPWKKTGDYILILAPNPGPLSYYTNFSTALEWCLDIKQKLSNYTDRKIFFRFKENTKNRKLDPLEKYLDNCYALITLQSIACVEAISKGIPTINLAPSCLDALYKCDLSNIETIPQPENRYEWLKSLSYSHFTWEEMENGFALNTLERYQI